MSDPDNINILLIIPFPFHESSSIANHPNFNRLLEDVSTSVCSTIPFPPFFFPTWEHFNLPINRNNINKYISESDIFIELWQYQLDKRFDSRWTEWESYCHNKSTHIQALLKYFKKLQDKKLIGNMIVLSVIEGVGIKDHDTINATIHELNLTNVKINLNKESFNIGSTEASYFNYPCERLKLKKHLHCLTFTDKIRIELERELNKVDWNSLAPHSCASIVQKTSDVYIGTAVPAAIKIGDEFVARFTAYTANYRDILQKTINQEAHTSNPFLDLEVCKWKLGAKVTVHCHSSDLEIQNPIQNFKWNGSYHILRFDAKVKNGISNKSVILKYDIAVEKLPILFVRPEITLVANDDVMQNKHDFNMTEQTLPKTAFASYEKTDRRIVLGRVRSVQISTGIDVFLDCLSLKPGEEWKPKLESEIISRDIFWLFWSRHAMESKWVDWEWRTALKHKTIKGIQPHPLEPADVAPPPEELSKLQFGSLFEWYISHLEKKKGKTKNRRKTETIADANNA